MVALIEKIAGRSVGVKTLAALRRRAGVLRQTDAALRAVLSPRESGGFSHRQRAALACRVARIHGNEPLASFYRDRIAAGDAHADAICDPGFRGGDDARLQAVLAFTDLVSGRPAETTAQDIEALKSAGISDPDIVRLAELNAFLAYHIRAIEGFVLMAESG